MKKSITGLTFAATALFGMSAFAAEPSAVPYSYSQHLDIAKVISMSPIPDNECGVVPATMKYEDSKGVTHVMSYQVVGNGCSKQ